MVTAVFVVGMAVLLWELATPEFLSFYDSGAYVAAAARLFEGHLPYRDFTFVQPPGILLALSPEALIGRITNSHDAFVVARWASGVVTSLNASLVAMLVRRWGRVAMLAAGSAVATLPVAIYTTSSIKLETYSLFFALLAGVVLLGPKADIAFASTRRVLIAGLLFGFAVSFKFLGVLPLIATVGLLAWSSRRRAMLLALAALGGFGVVTGPFAVFAPRAFWHQAVVAQLLRRGDPTDAMSMVTRLGQLTGFGGTTALPRGLWIYGLWAAVAIVAVVAFRRPRERSSADWLVASSALTVGVGLLIPAHAYNYYFYQAAPYEVGLMTVVIAALVREARGARDCLSAQYRRLVAAVLAGAMALAIVGLVLWVTSFYAAQAWAFGFYGPWTSQLSRVIPADACAIYTLEGYGVYVNRITSGDPHCPVEIDSYGMWLPYHASPNLPGPPPRGLVREWRSMFGSARYAVLNQGALRGTSGAANVPWTPRLYHWFLSHYRRIYSGHYVDVFVRRA